MLISRGVTRKAVAKKFGVSPQTISRATEGVEKPENRGAHNRKRASTKYFREDFYEF